MNAVADGHVFISPAVAGELLANYLHCGPSDGSELERITARERQVLQLIGEGATNREIADTLNLSQRTVETHRYRLMKRLGAHSVADIVLIAARNGLVHSPIARNHGRMDPAFSPAEANRFQPS